MSSSREGRVAVVTGGSGALGRAVVRALLDRGAVVHVPWIEDGEIPQLEAVVAGDMNRVRLHPADLTDPTAVSDLFGRVQVADGPVGILVNVAGAFAYAPIDETDHSTWSRMIAQNATTCFLCSRAAVSQMLEEGWGRIVNVAAVPAVTGAGANMTAYSASKAAVLNLSRSLAAETMGRGVTVNAIVPTVIDTAANREAMPTTDRTEWLAPEDIADVVAFLVGDQAGIVTGNGIRLGPR